MKFSKRKLKKISLMLDFIQKMRYNGNNTTTFAGNILRKGGGVIV